MVEESIINSIKRYINELVLKGIPIKYAILFGSYAHNRYVDRWSDIDLLIVSPSYDRPYSREDVNILWKTSAHIDSRIEPIPVGLRQWETDDESTIIEIARREGIQIKV